MPLLGSRRFARGGQLSLPERRKLVSYLRGNYQLSKWKLEERHLTRIIEMNFTLKQVVGYLYYAFAECHDKRICGDKTPPFLRKLKVLIDAYPEARFIHIIRDGRDSYLSLRKKGSLSASSAGIASLEWNTKELLIEQALRKTPGRTMDIRYEDLIRDPLGESQRVCDFLKVYFEEGMLEFWKDSGEFIDRQHSNLIFMPIDSSNSKKWMNEMNSEDVTKYEYFAGKRLRRYGYPVSQSGAALHRKITYVAELIAFLPKRVLRVVWIALFMRYASKMGAGVPRWYYE
jgi:Sulfotransferase family